MPGQYVSDYKIHRVKHSQVTDENAERLWQVSATMVETGSAIWRTLKKI